MLFHYSAGAKWLAVILVLAAAGQGVQALTFEQTKMLFERRVEKLQKDEAQALAKLAAGYTAQMEELLENLTASGNLDGALAVKGEMERVGKGEFGEKPEFDAAKAPRLQTLRGKFDVARSNVQRVTQAEVREARSKYLQLLENEVRKLTRQKKLDAAVQVRQEAEKVKAAMAEKSADEEVVDLAEFLEGKVYTYERSAGTATNIHFLRKGKGFVEDDASRPFVWKAKGDKVIVSDKRSVDLIELEFSEDRKSYRGEVLFNNDTRKGTLLEKKAG